MLLRCIKIRSSERVERSRWFSMSIDFSVSIHSCSLITRLPSRAIRNASQSTHNINWIWKYFGFVSPSRSLSDSLRPAGEVDDEPKRKLLIPPKWSMRRLSCPTIASVFITNLPFSLLIAFQRNSRAIKWINQVQAAKISIQKTCFSHAGSWLMED